MSKRFTKALAVCMAFGVLAGSGTFTAMSQNTAIQKAAAKESTKIIGIAESEKESQKEEIEKKGSQDTEKDFLIQAKNKTERKKVTAVLKNCMDSTSDTADTLKNENILLADLSAKQINELNQKYDITIEQDRRIEGSAQNKITKTEQKAIERMVKKQWSRKAVGAEAINVSAMQKYFKATSAGKKICNKYYTDSVNYMKKRYLVGTKVATEELLNRFATGGSFSPYVFCPYSSDKNYRYQLRSLAKFIKKAGYDVKEYNLYSVEQWNALSY